jgi:hypothetical protein
MMSCSSFDDLTRVTMSSQWIRYDFGEKFVKIAETSTLTES